jgi:hypothetical protein
LQCYDFLQDAREKMNAHNDEGAGFATYKAMEVLEAHFGNEKLACAVLGNTFKKTKTAANEKRHIPKKVEKQPKTSIGVLELATTVIRSYERHLLEKESHP